MKKYIPILEKMPLFYGITDEGYTHILHCLEAFEISVPKGQVLHRTQTQVEYGVIILKGALHEILPNLNGTEHCIREYSVGELIGGSYACLPLEEVPVQIQAVQDSTLLCVRLSNLLKDSSIGCKYASQITANLLRHVSCSNITQVKKIHILTQNKIRNKLLMYLESIDADKKSTSIHFSRQKLADYLGVERSALCREMSRMQQEGMITYNKNTIKIVTAS